MAPAVKPEQQMERKGAEGWAGVVRQGVLISEGSSQSFSVHLAVESQVQGQKKSFPMTPFCPSFTSASFPFNVSGHLPYVRLIFFF